MADFLVYQEGTGRIVGSGWCAPADVENQARPGCRVLPFAADPAAAYVDLVADPPAVLTRPVLSGFARTTVAVGEVVGMDVPDPCEVAIDGVSHTVTGGRLEVAPVHPGVYVVTVDAFPYHPFRAEITCRPPSS